MADQQQLRAAFERLTQSPRSIPKKDRAVMLYLRHTANWTPDMEGIAATLCVKYAQLPSSAAKSAVRGNRNRLQVIADEFMTTPRRAAIQSGHTPGFNLYNVAGDLIEWRSARDIGERLKGLTWDFTQEQLDALLTSLSAVTVSVRERSRQARHHWPLSLYVTLPSPELARVTSWLHDLPHSLPAIQLGERHCIETALWHLPDLRAYCQEQGVQLEGQTNLGHLDEVEARAIDLAARLPATFAPDMPNLYLASSLRTPSQQRLIVIGPYDPERVAQARTVPGRDWTGEGDEYPLSSFPEVTAHLREFGGTSWLTDDQQQHCEVATEEKIRHEASLKAQEQARQQTMNTVYLTQNASGRPLLHFKFDYNPLLKDMIAAECDLFFLSEPEVSEKGWYAQITDLLSAASAAELVNFKLSEEVQGHLRALAHAAEQDRQSAPRATALKQAEKDGKAAPSLPPGLPLQKAFYDHQRLPVALWPYTRRLLLADEQGMGKCPEAISILLTEQTKAEYRAVIVSPDNVTLTWESEWHKFTAAPAPMTLKGKKPAPLTADRQTVIIGWSILHDWLETLLAWNSTVIVVDEGQLGNAGEGPNGSKRSAAALALCRQVLMTQRGGGVMVLTGTPLDNRPLNLLALFSMLGVEREFGGRHKFKERYCRPKTIHIAQGRTKTVYEGASNTAELRERLHQQPWYVRRTKKLLIKQGTMQPKLVNGRDWYDFSAEEFPQRVQLTPSGQATYQGAVLEFETYLRGLVQEEHPLLDVTDPANLDFINRIIARKMSSVLPKLSLLRLVVARLKMDSVCEAVLRLHAQGEQVMLIAHHREIVEEYATRLFPDRVLRLQGGMSAAEVERVKRQFNSGDVHTAPLLIVSMHAAKVGHNFCLQKEMNGTPECANVLIAEEDFNPGAESQAMDRVWRIPQTRQVNVTNILASDTLDEGMFALKRAKRRAQSAVTDGEDIDGDADFSGMLAAWIHGLNFKDAAEAEQESAA